MAYRLTTRVEEWVEQAIGRYALGDRITWDCTFAMTPEGAQMLMAFFLPGAILGSMVQTVVIMQNLPNATEEDINQVVADTIENLRKGRSEQMVTAGAGSG
jgi:hypothetical protein